MKYPKKEEPMERFVCKEGAELQSFLLTGAFSYENMDASDKIRRIRDLETGRIVGFITKFDDGSESAIIKE